jgi:hypothetical protein
VRTPADFAFSSDGVYFIILLREGRREPAPESLVAKDGVMATVTIEMDLPAGVTLTGYERVEEGHGFEVAWPLRANALHSP